MIKQNKLVSEFGKVFERKKLRRDNVGKNKVREAKELSEESCFELSGE